MLSQKPTITHAEGEEPMYRLKMGVPVHAVQFTGINVMELFVLIPSAKWIYLTPNETIKIYYESRTLKHSFDDISLNVHDWLIVDDAGPMAVTDDMFHQRYERNDGAHHYEGVEDATS